jgi:hypothetical protein
VAAAITLALHLASLAAFVLFIQRNERMRSLLGT